MPTPTHTPVRQPPGTWAPDTVSSPVVLTVPGLPQTVSEARAFARQLLGGQHAGLDMVVLLLSELVTNSVRHSRSGHSGGLITIAITDSGTIVHVEVTDEGSDHVPSLFPADDRSEQGYGLALVEALATRWGFSRSGAKSTTCWFEVRAAL
jgi:anti-sigma regulatory factor (Ser/Thr protein kinase)